MREFRFVLTPFCNYQCFFCHGENACKGISMLLKPSDYRYLARVAKEHYGWTTATITGGEPLISPIYRDVCRELKNEGIDITVVSNVSLLARPKEMLEDVAQLNVSVHSMDAETYEKIIGVGYGIENIIQTIKDTREQLPNLVIHMNYTVIRGMNDRDIDFENVLAFARQVNAVVKFIDLSSEDVEKATKAEDIVEQLQRLGFAIESQNAWQYRLNRGNEKTMVSRCPFNGRYEDLPVRDIFVDPNGVLYTSFGGGISVGALEDIKNQDGSNLISKIDSLIE